MFLDPGVPEVRDHVVAVYRELAARYDIDGIHIDYLRYESREWGYNPVALARFVAATGHGRRPAPSDPAWSAWRRQQVTSLAERIAAAVREADPAVAVTLAGVAKGPPPATPTSYANTDTFSDVLQPWPDWLKGGVIDAVFPMNYLREHDPDQQAWFDGWVAFEARLARDCAATTDHACEVAVGQAGFLNTVGASLAQLDAALAATDGLSVYSYQQNAATRPYHALLRRLADGAFADPAPAPSPGG